MTTPEERIKAAAEAIDKATAPVLVNSGFVAQQALAAAYPEGCGRGGAMTTPEERIKAAAEAMRRGGRQTSYEDLARLAAPILNPEDFPPKPKWPTDESVRLAFEGFAGEPTERDRLCLRKAFLADPIHKASVAHRTRLGSAATHDDHCPICRAVNEAGL